MNGGGVLVSVVIPTRNQSGLLREAIEAVWRQTVDPATFEIIVVDNCSTDDTAAVVREMSARAPCSMVYHCMEENRGPANSRNQGVRLARGELIAFTDSDCRPVPQWLALGQSAMADTNVALVTGQVLYPPGQKITFFSRAAGEARYEHPSYPTCNAWYRRKVFLDLGGFDVNLCFHDFRNRPVECADTDLAWRVKEAGYRNVFVPEMIVHHRVEVLPPLNWAMEPFRLFVLPALVRRHPQLRRALLTWGVFFTRDNAWFYLALLGLGLGPVWHVAFLLLMVPYVAWAARAGNPRLTLLDLHRMAVRAVLIAARQAFLCAGLLYGSLRFRTIVL